MPISAIMFDTSSTGNTTDKKQKQQEQHHHQDDSTSTTIRHRIEAIVFTPTTPFSQQP
jgi:hypothetical protein